MRVRILIMMAMLIMVALSGTAWSQHPGHPQGTPVTTGQKPGAGPNVPVLNIRDAIKECQGIARDLEKAARPWDDARFAELASRYEASIDQLVQSVDSSPEDERTYAKNLDLAQRSLTRQLQQLQKMSAVIPAASNDLMASLADAVTLGRDSVLAQQEAFLRGAAGAGRGGHHDGASHGCGRGIGWLSRLWRH